MTKDLEQTAPEQTNLPQSIAASPSLATPSLSTLAAQHQPHTRTFGEKAVDFLVYPVINNFIVIGTSVVATYLTKRGDTVGHEGSTIRKIGNVLKKRGDWMQDKFEKYLGMNEKSADMAKMVFFSFADGTVLTPFVKLLEDRREDMARWIDSHLGHKPANELVYKAEPKQTWKSVIGGRLATLSVVLATAIGLDQKIKGRPTNDRIFDKPSKKLAEILEEHTKIKKHFPKLDTVSFSKTLLFEAVYTSICTAGLYFVSRAFVKHSKTYKERVQEYQLLHQDQPASNITKDNTVESLSTAQPPFDKPATAVTQTTHQQRVSAPAAQEITV